MDLGSLFVKIGADLTNLKAGIGEAKSQLASFASNAETSGTVLSAAVSLPLIAMGGFAAKLAGDMEKAGLSFKVLLKDQTAALALQAQLVKFSAETPFEFKDVQQGAKQLLAYGFAVGDVSKYLRTAGDLAAGMDVKITEVTSALGRLKSGNFGEAFERLRELGIDRTALEGAGLKFDKQGSYVGSVKDAMGAVEKVIGEKFGGMTQALSQSLPGMLATAMDSVQLALSDIGGSLVQAFDVKFLLGSFSSALDGIKNGFMSLSPMTQKMIFGLAGLAVVVPPILAGFGLLSSTILPAIAAGFAAIISPVGLTVAAVVAGVAAIVYHWDSIKKAFGNTAIFKGLKDLFANAFGVLSSIVGVFVNAFQGDWTNMWQHAKNIVKYAWNGIISLTQAALGVVAKGFTTILGVVAPETAAKLQGFLDKSISVFDGVKAKVPPITNAVETLKGGYTSLSSAVTNFGSTSKDAGEKAVKSAKDVTKALIEASDARIKAGLDAIKFRDKGGNNTGIVGAYMAAPNRDLKIKPVNTILPDMSKAIDTNALANKLREAQEKAVLALKESRLTQALEDLNERATGILRQGAEDMFTGFGEMIAGMAMGQTGAESIGKMLLGTIGGIVTQLGRMAIGIGVGMLGIKTALQSLNPVAAIAAGVALVAMGSIFKSGAANLGNKFGSGQKPRSYAAGYGAAYRPTMMQFGDHPNASMGNPEYVLRHDQVKSMLNRAADNAGGSNGGFIAQTEISGEKLLILLRRAERKANP